jgi:glycosyltransferase involved in cell wall biosynthesis
VELSDITPLILTYNEAPNLPRTLGQLHWAQEIVVIDSGSSDKTKRIAQSHSNVRFLVRPFDDHRCQWNFGLSQVTTEWTLALDADYLCPPGLAEELQSLNPTDDAYAADFTYAVGGHPLRGTLYPRRVVLFKTKSFQYVQDGHTQRLETAGRIIERLQTKIIHDDRKPLSRWLASQAQYASLEADKLMAQPYHQLGWKDRLRRQIFWAAPLTFFYCLMGKRLILDGWPGIYYSLQRTYAELLLSLELLERRLYGRPTNILCPSEAAPPPREVELPNASPAELAGSTAGVASEDLN